MVVQNKQQNRQPKVIAIGNPKGGVGKTATTVSIARIIKDDPAFRGKKVLLIDTDPLGILTKMIVSRKVKVTNSMTLIPVLQHSESIRPTIRENAWPDIHSGVTIDYICSNRAVTKLESIERFDLYRFRDALDEIRDEYFRIFIDCPANSNNLYFASCVAADMLIFPFGAIESLSGLEVTCTEMCLIDETMIDRVKILFTMQDVRSELTASLINTARQYLDFPQFETIIRRCQRFGLELADGQTSGSYHIPDSIAINDYLFLVEELFSAEFGKEFKNKQRFSFGQTRIDERLWASFYETSFMISNAREKARREKPRDARQELEALQRSIRAGESISASEASEKKSSHIFLESCFKVCSNTRQVFGEEFFYIAELLPSFYRQVKKKNQNLYTVLFHDDCLEKFFLRMFFEDSPQYERFDSLKEAVSAPIAPIEVRMLQNMRKRLENGFLTLIRDPQSPDSLSFFVHIWNLLRERDYIMTWSAEKWKRELHHLGPIATYIKQKQTLIFTRFGSGKEIKSPLDILATKDYSGFRNFTRFLDEKLRKIGN